MIFLAKQLVLKMGFKKVIKLQILTKELKKNKILILNSKKFNNNNNKSLPINNFNLT